LRQLRDLIHKYSNPQFPPLVDGHSVDKQYALSMNSAEPYSYTDSRPIPSISARDQKIITLARQKLSGKTPSYDDAICALHDAVTALIPAGRIYLLAITANGPIIGSMISGIGIMTQQSSIQLVRVRQAPHALSIDSLGRFLP
jgi:hypothetical protein